MIRPSAVLRVIAKAAGWCLALLVGVVVVWFAANRLLDQEVSLAQKSISAPKHRVADHRNIAVGIVGLTAPKGADPMQFAVHVMELRSRNAPFEQIEETLRGAKALRPTVESDQVTCWLDPDWPLPMKECLPFEKAPDVLEENKELIQRYKALHELDQYAAADIPFNSHAFLVLTRLVVAEMHLDLRKRDYEAAYQKWYRQLRFTKGNLKSPDTWVGKAVGLVVLGMTLPFLDNLLLASPELARTHRVELGEILQPHGIGAFDPDGIAAAEYQLLANAFAYPPVKRPEHGADPVHWLAFHLGQKNRVLNRYATYAPDYAAGLRLPWGDIERDSSRLRDKHLAFSAWDWGVDPFGSVLVAEFIDGQLRAREMLRQMHIMDGRFRLGTLLVRLINDNVRDEDIPKFLVAAGPQFYDPLSRAPAAWDPKDRKIYFVDSRERCMIISLFRVRDLNRAPKLRSKSINMDAC